MGIEEAVNYRRVSDKVATSGIVSSEQLSRLKSEGFEAVVNLLPDESESATRDERAMVEKQGLEYHYIPVDFGHPTAADFAAFASALDGVGEKRVLIHCAANYRVSAFYSLYAMKRCGWSEEDASALIGSLWDPAGHPLWRDFMERMKRQ